MENTKKRKLESEGTSPQSLPSQSDPPASAPLSSPEINVTEVLQNLQKHLLNEK
jgi:hypothetical protein